MHEARARGRFPARFRVDGAGPDGRHRIVDPQSGQRWAIGATELAVLRQFDGVSTYGEILHVLQERARKPFPLEKLRTFEAKLLANGLLESGEPGRVRDPFTGFHFGWLHRLIVIKLLAGNPQRALDAILLAAPWLTSRACIAAALLFTVAVLGAVCTRLPVLWGELPAALASWGVVWLYAVAVSSALFHEGGHALACRRYGVTVREMGVAIYFLLPFAWTRPDQDAWSGLPLRARLTTIFAGPFGSLLFAALGGLAWLLDANGGFLSLLGVYALISGMIGVIPTMLPIFNGDGYLLITELFGLPNLRRRAFEHLRVTFTDPRRAARAAPRQRLLYLSVSVGTIAGWIAVTLFVLWSVWTFSLSANMT